jgi:hypothetical protein
LARDRHRQKIIAGMSRDKYASVAAPFTAREPFLLDVGRACFRFSAIRTALRA